MTEEDRFIQLETKIAYLENYINELNGVWSLNRIQP
jgi:uncharacterized coiled-coil protein SlyX